MKITEILEAMVIKDADLVTLTKQGHVKKRDERASKNTMQRYFDVVGDVQFELDGKTYKKGDTIEGPEWDPT